MAIEFGTPFTISERRRLYTDEERAAFLENLHPAFTTLWFADHPQDDVLEAWTSATYVAARLPRYKVGTLVLSQSYRNPGLLAKMGATLQRLSGGRLIMGLGAGWSEPDYLAYNYEFAAPGVRVAQLAETIELLRAMWSANPAAYHGQYYHVEAADCSPLPDPPIPILVGTNGKKAMQVAARLADIWSWDMRDDFPDLLATLRRSAVEYGRKPEDIAVYVETPLHFPDDPADFVPEQVNTQYPGIGNSSQVGPTPKDAIEQMKRYMDLGVSQFIIEGDARELRRFSEEVAPALV